MDNKNQLVNFIIVGIVCFLLGGGIGIISMQNASQRTKIEAANSLSSKVVSSIVAYGQVKSINGRNITLSNLGDELSILIADNAQVYSFSAPVAGKNGVVAPVQQIIKFGDIKIGDSVNVSVKLLPSGQIQGTSIIILPPTAKK